LERAACPKRKAADNNEILEAIILMVDDGLARRVSLAKSDLFLLIGTK
jgi:hypothetical protein